MHDKQQAEPAAWQLKGNQLLILIQAENCFIKTENNRTTENCLT